jgi:TonB family protein
MLKRWLYLVAFFFLGAAFGFSSGVMQRGEYERAGSPRGFSTPGEKVSRNGCKSASPSAFPPLQPGMTPPKVIFNPDPSYPDRARKAKRRGTVILRAGIGSDGTVQEVCVLRSASPDLDESAVNTAKKWRFEPALKDGVAVPVSMPLEMSFNLY